MDSSDSSTSEKSDREPKNSIGVAIESKSVFEAIKEAERRGVNPNVLMRASQAFRGQLYQLVEAANVDTVKGRIGDTLSSDLPISAAPTGSATSRSAGNTTEVNVCKFCGKIPYCFFCYQ